MGPPRENHVLRPAAQEPGHAFIHIGVELNTVASLGLDLGIVAQETGAYTTEKVVRYHSLKFVFGRELVYEVIVDALNQAGVELSLEARLACCYSNPRITEVDLGNHGARKGEHDVYGDDSCLKAVAVVAFVNFPLA